MAKIAEGTEVKGTQETSTDLSTQAPDKKLGELNPKPSTEVTQGTVKDDPLAGIGKENADQVRLIESLLGEYTTTVTRQSDLGDAARGGFGKLHGAFRTMMSLRGEAHKQAARVFLKFFASHGKTSLDYDMRCRHLDLLPHDQRPVFTGYMDLLARFVKAQNKGQFRQNNNIDRLLARILDKELQASVDGVFPK